MHGFGVFRGLFNSSNFPETSAFLLRFWKIEVYWNCTLRFIAEDTKQSYAFYYIFSVIEMLTVLLPLISNIDWKFLPCESWTLVSIGLFCCSPPYQFTFFSLDYRTYEHRMCIVYWSQLSRSRMFVSQHLRFVLN